MKKAIVMSGLTILQLLLKLSGPTMTLRYYLQIMRL
jgi:hypothetical protein